MEKDNQIVVLYRMAGSHLKNPHKEKLSQVNNISCYLNAKKAFPSAKFIVFTDDVPKAEALQIKDQIINVEKSDNAKSLWLALSEAANLPDDTVVYLLEDDYIHDFTAPCEQAIEEGLNRFDYVTLYDHPDKHGRMDTRVFATQSTHWMLTHSTTMTFAGKSQKIRSDLKHMEKFIQNGIPNDHHMWIDLLSRGRSLASCIPGMSTHGEVNWLSPTKKWQEYL